MKQHTYIISGRVQGISFRDFTRARAEELGLTGTVENMPDGTVKVVAEGNEAKLKQLLLELKEKHPLARVTDIALSVKEATCAFPGFEIVYRRFLDHSS